ncbi:unnamed protein product [Prorocentrum cordatum]|uniref:RNA-dependent RNA polymerase n=1 Tax=Prorocentrum cordatum TaxID=2364126 RepID=A0ABN9STU6_9DINO|nr:unnamed protein product [Polarella glacialis]CAK0856988.1 unnamed protein product [Polarella glacialis]
MEPLAKRQRLLDMLSRRNFSDSDGVAALAALGRDEAASRRDARECVDTFTADFFVQPTLQRQGGDAFDWTIAKYQLLPPRCLAQCAGFREEFENAVARSPNSFDRPWRLALYIDDAAWLPVGVLRATIAKDLQGGFPAAAKALLRSLLLGSDSVAVAGASVPRGGQSRIMYFKFQRLIGDEVATKAFFDAKGFGGIRCCSISCKNVVKLNKDGVTDSLVDHQTGTYLVDVSCSDPSQFDPVSDEDVWRTHDILDAVCRRGGALKTAQTTMGFSLNEHGVLADKGLRPHVLPHSCLLRDCMRVYLAGGIANIEIGLLFNGVAECTPGFSFRLLKTFAEADWHWNPGGLTRSEFADIFNGSREKAWKSGGVFRAGAPELLSAYPFIRYFVVEHVPAHKVQLERQSYLRLCDVLDSINEAKHYSTPVAMKDIMRRAVGRFLDAHKAACRLDAIVPKHHYQWHAVSDQEDDIFLDCFVYERKNKIAKQSMTHIANAAAFEKSSVQQLLVKVFPAMGKVRMTELCEPVAVSQPLSDKFGQVYVVSKQMRWRGLLLRVGSVVFIQNAAVEVQVCLSAGGVLALIVGKLALVRREPLGGYSIWTGAGQSELLVPEGARKATGWFLKSDNTLAVIH